MVTTPLDFKVRVDSLIQTLAETSTTQFISKYLLVRKSLQMNDFDLTVSDLYI